MAIALAIAVRIERHAVLVRPVPAGSLLKRGRRRDDHDRPLTLYKSLPHEAAQDNRNALARRTHQLAQEPVLRRVEGNATVFADERTSRGETADSREEPLLDGKRGQLVKALQLFGALGHYLSEQREGLLRLFANECTEPHATEVERLALFLRAGICGVNAIGGKAFRPKGFSSARERGSESTTRLHATTQRYPSPKDDEHAVRVRAAMIDLKVGRPGRTRAVGGNCVQFFGAEVG